MATTTAFSGFGFVPAGGADCCTCEEAPCTLPVTCSGDVIMPAAWTLIVDEITGTLIDTGDPGSETCEWASEQVAGTWYLAAKNRVIDDGGAWESYDVACSASSVDIEQPVSHEGLVKFPLKPPGTLLAVGTVAAWQVQIVYDSLDPTPVTITLTGRISPPAPFGSGIYVVYELATTTLDLTAGDTVLSLLSNDTDCTVPSSLTLSPAGEAIQNIVANCERHCEFGLGDGDYSQLIFDGTIGGVAVHLCLSYSGFNETLASPLWSGSGTFTFSCGSKNIRIRIYCGLLDPMDTERQWLIEFTNVTDAGDPEKFELTIGTADPLAATVSETLVELCGSDVVVANVSACTDPPFADCCSDPDDRAALCCYDFDNFPMEGSTEALDPEGVADIGEDCTGTASSMGYTIDPLTVNQGGSPYTPSGFVPAEGYLSGVWPFNTNTQRVVVLYCDAGTLKAFWYDPTLGNEAATEQALNDQTCVGGWVEYPDAEAGCFIPGGVNRRIDFG